MDRKNSGFWRYGDIACTGLWDVLDPFTRFWGIATSIILCGVGAELAVYRNIAGIYILIGAGIVFFLEIMWVITLFVELCTHYNEYTLALRCWDAFACCRLRWVRCPLYIPPALLLLFWPRLFWLTRVSGGMLLTLALLHLIVAAAARPKHPLLPNQHHHLVTDGASDCGTDRYDDLTEVVDDSCCPSSGNNNRTSIRSSTSTTGAVKIPENKEEEEEDYDDDDENVIIEI